MFRSAEEGEPSGSPFGPSNSSPGSLEIVDLDNSVKSVTSSEQEVGHTRAAITRNQQHLRTRPLAHASDSASDSSKTAIAAQISSNPVTRISVKVDSVDDSL